MWRAAGFMLQAACGEFACCVSRVAADGAVDGLVAAGGDRRSGDGPVRVGSDERAARDPVRALPRRRCGLQHATQHATFDATCSVQTATCTIRHTLPSQFKSAPQAYAYEADTRMHKRTSPGDPYSDPGAGVAGVSPVPAQMWARVGLVPAQMWARVGPVPAQMWQG